jgi:hypothetical protein
MSILFRCSSIGKLMTEPAQIDDAFRTPQVEEILAKKKRTDEEKALLAALKARTLSIGAKSFIRELVAEQVLGVEFEFSSKETEKGTLVEQDGIDLLNRVRGLSLTKNTERRRNEWITGEADLVGHDRGHDLKCSWSAKTFPICVVDCEDKLYEWQMRGYMALWDKPRWEVNYALVDTPEHLIGYEPIQLHSVGHIPEPMRLTTWVIERDRKLELAMVEKVKLARIYFQLMLEEFDRTHALPAQLKEAA